MASLARRCVKAVVEAVTKVTTMAVTANSSLIMDGPPPQGPSSSIPSWM